MTDKITESISPDIHTDKVDLTPTMIDGEMYYQISNNDAMRPFFMSIVSDSNHWMFVSSNGGITVRKNAEYALFPTILTIRLLSLPRLQAVNQF